MMADRFLFCGTGAADFKEPVEGEEFRKYTHSLLNDFILFDIGINAYKYEDEEVIKQRFSMVKHILITHSHGDHFCPAYIQRLAEDNGGVTVYIDSGVVELVPVSPLIKVVPIATGDILRIDGYTVYVLPSNHTTGNNKEATHHYVVDTPERKTLFYALDSAWLLTDETNFLLKHPADLIVLDCTLGRQIGDKRIFEHNSIFMLEIMMQTLVKCKMLRPGGLVYGTHLAKYLHPTQKEVEADLHTFGMHAAYDGLCIEF